MKESEIRKQLGKIRAAAEALRQANLSEQGERDAYKAMIDAGCELAQGFLTNHARIADALETANKTK